MTDKQTDALRLADALERPGYGWHSTPAQCAAELRRLHAEIETLREKLKTYEDLGDAGSDVQLLRTGYAAARLEIESLKAQLAERASHGQAPAQAAPAAVLKFERGTPGRQNEMPRVVSCNWMPDGEYEVYLAAASTTTAQAAERVPAGPRRKDMLWSTVKMQERYDQRIENIVSGLERIKQEHAGQQPQKIDECYGDCPTDSTTCTNPCRFDGRAVLARWGQPAHSGEPLTHAQAKALVSKYGNDLLHLVYQVEVAHGITGGQHGAE